MAGIAGQPSIVTSGLVLFNDAANRKSFTIPIIVYSVQCYSVYGSGLRSANYTVQYSDDNSTWTTAFTGVMSNNSSCGIITGTGVNTSDLTPHRYWRYVEGSAVAGHHPRVSRIDFITSVGSVVNLVTYTSDNCVDSGTYIVGTVSKDFGPSTWNDLSGNSNNGTLTNGPSFNGSNLGSIVFDGTNDYVDCGNNASLRLNDVTVEAWIYISANPSDWVRIFGVGIDNGGTTNRMYGLWYNGTNASVTRNLLWQRYSPSVSIYATGTTLSLNTWYQVVATTAGSAQTLYLNASSIGTDTVAGPWTANTANNFTIAYAGFHTYHNGRIAIVRVYNRGLTAAEVLQNYNSTKTRFGL